MSLVKNKKGKRILFIGYNFSPELTGIGKYSGEMMTWLAKQGYTCTALVAYPYYPYWCVQEPYHSKRFLYSTETQIFDSGGSLILHRCPMYVPTKPSGLKRMLLDGSFSVTAFIRLLPLLASEKFDTVVTVAPSFQFGLLGILYKKLRQASMVYHIQDMQIEAARDLNMITNSSAIKALFKVEKYIFNNSDFVSSISEKMVSKVQEKAQKPVFLFPNWTDTKLFYPIADKAKLKYEFGFEPDNRIILYSGAVGEKQGLEAIIYAAQAFKQHKEIIFLICGSGPYKEELRRLAYQSGLDNVVFFPLQPLEKFNCFLNIADVHLVIQKATASDLVMPSKLTTILAVGGLALITANSDSGLYTLVQKYNMGILVAAENQQSLEEGIAAALQSDHSLIREQARMYAEQYLSIDNVMGAFEAMAL
jgi:colanic acid biosynthesis glycosyl transferase WcaI